MDKKLYKFISRAGLILLGIILLGLPYGCSKPSEEAELFKEKPAPDFTLMDTEGKKVSLKDFAGKIIVLNFWATWCPPCRAEIPDFIELYKQYESQGVVFIGISLDTGSASGNTDVVIPFIKKVGINYPVLLGNEEVTKTYGGVTAIPTTFIIDKKGIIRKKYVGYRPKEVFENDIKTLLAQE
ncbi:MAG: TlpA family protein disulfide reductase [Candidatus Sumerlaeia bacterium]|nr:TlpA family protein disulfide reductase [Candidatus Sumerlaeia bacterium]